MPIPTAIQLYFSQVDDLLLNLALALFVLVGFYVAARLARRLVTAAVARSSTEAGIDRTLGSMTFYAIIIAGIVTALSRFFQVGSLVTSLGLTSVAVGFALKDVLGNYLSGLLILAQRPFKVGDVVEIAGIKGSVHQLRIRDTAVRTVEGKLVLIPNSTVFGSVVANDSVFSRKRVSVPVAVPMGYPSDKLVALAESAFERIKEDHMEGPTLVFSQAGLESLELEVRFVVDAKKIQPETARSAFLAEFSRSAAGIYGRTSSAAGEGARRGD